MRVGAAMRRRLLSVLAVAAAAARAEAAPRAEASPAILHELNRATVRLAERVSPAVVQVQVTGFRPAGQSRTSEPAPVARQHAIGSGVIVDPEGYILTNHHVVRGAERIQVVVAGGPASAAGAEDGGRRRYDARLVGADPGLDIALLKIDARGLRALPLDAGVTVHQGELVFAIGSPEGLDRTMTMGVVGDAAREAAPSQPMAFIQTDAPINPGNSGGALVNVDGALVGINTFIVSESGGSQGLGFAIPVAMAKIAYDGLRRDGHVHLVDAGIGMQAIDHPLAAALGLPRDWGVIVGDVALGGPAHAAGVQPGDVVVSIDGRPIDSLADVTTARYLHPAKTPVRIVVQRGGERLALSIDAREKPRHADLADLSSSGATLIRRLGIIAVDVGPGLQGVIPPLRIGTGVVVAARTLDTSAVESGLEPGDVIHAVNRATVASVEDVRRILGGLKRGDPVAIQIERDGKLVFLSFEME